MKNQVLKFGIIGGLILAVAMLTTIIFLPKDFHQKWGVVIGYITMLIGLSTVFLGTKSFRDNQQAGLITFGKAFKIGLYITLIASTFYVLAWFIYSNTAAGQEMIDQYIQFSIDKIKASDASPEEIQASIAKINDNRDIYKNHLFNLGMAFLEIFPIGLIITLISSLILKKGK